MKTTTASADPKAFAKLKEMVTDIDIAMVTSVTVEGGLRSRPLVTREFEEDGVLWFFVADDSSLAEDLREEHAVNVSYAEPKSHRYVSVTGNANLVHDPDKARRLWASSLKPYFPRGLDDPHLTLLNVRIETAEYWDAPSSKMIQLLHGRKHADPGGSGVGENVKVDIRNARASG
jgi:general stress protein 26